MLKIISCAGFGNTGSSIVTDFFNEFSSIKNYGGSSFEFYLLHEADGIRDLEYALTEGNRLNTDLAIKRFIKLITSLNNNNSSGPNYKDFFNGKFLEYTYEYLNSLGVIKWNNGLWHRAYDGVKENRIKKIIGKERFKKLTLKNKYSLYEADTWKPSFFNYTDQYFCNISNTSFKEKTKKYLEKLFLEMANEGQYLLFDQLFPSNVNQECLDYFDFAKVIIVDRDPRDLYFLNKVFWGSGYIPSENVNTYIKWFKSTRENISKNSNILCIKFEDMIFKTEQTQKKLCDFVGIDINLHDKPRTHLFIEKSVTNTQVYKRYELTNEIEKNRINQDIQQIETDLRNYIYLFPKLENISMKKQKFMIETIYKQINKKNIFDILYFFIGLSRIIVRNILFIIKRIVRKIIRR